MLVSAFEYIAYFNEGITMKKIFAILVSVALMLAFSACASTEVREELLTSEVTISTITETTSGQTEEETSIETSVVPLIEDQEKLKTLLTNVFSNDAYQTIVTIEENKASVFIIYDEISSLYSNVCAGDQESMEMWDELVSSFVGLHNSARDLISTLYGDYLLKTGISDAKGFPYLSITDGEIDYDFFHMGEQ